MTVSLSLPIYLLWSFLIVAVEESGRYLNAAAITVVVVLALGYVNILPGAGRGRLIDRWAAGHELDRATALEATYALARGTVVRTVMFNAVVVGLLSAVTGAIAGATDSRPVEYGVLGALVGPHSG